MTTAVYVAAPFEDAPHVRDLHERLRALGLYATGTWVTYGSGAKEDFSSLTPEQLRAIAEQNDANVQRSDAMLVLARPGAGGEMFAEARYALLLGLRVFWVGRLTLSAWRPGVTRCADLDDAVARLVTL